MVILPLILAWTAGSFDQDANFRSLVPAEPLPLGGYSERSGAKFTEGGQDLGVFTIRTGNTVIAAVELVTIPRSLAKAVRQRTPGLNVVLFATHTHCAPDSQLLNDRMTVPVPGVATFQRKWLNWYADEIASAVKVTRELSGEWSAQSYFAPLARARRKLAVPDNRVVTIMAGGRPALTLFGAHPTLMEPTWTKLDGDWPGAYMRRYGGLCVTGPIGDASPVPPAPGLAMERQPDLFARGLNQAILTGGVESLPAPTVKRVPIKVPAAIAHPDFAASYKITPEIAKIVVEKFAEPEAEITLLTFGKFVVVGVPGEPTAAVARDIQEIGRKNGFSQVYVASHCDGWIGYLLQPADYDRGGYEATLSFYGREGANAVLDAVRVGLKSAPDGADPIGQIINRGL